MKWLLGEIFSETWPQPANTHITALQHHAIIVTATMAMIIIATFFDHPNCQHFYKDHHHGNDYEHHIWRNQWRRQDCRTKCLYYGFSSTIHQLSSNCTTRQYKATVSAGVQDIVVAQSTYPPVAQPETGNLDNLSEIRIWGLFGCFLHIKGLTWPQKLVKKSNLTQLFPSENLLDSTRCHSCIITHKMGNALLCLPPEA